MAISPCIIFEAIIGHHSTLTAALYLRRVSVMQNINVDNLNSSTYHTKVQPSLLVNIALVFGLRGLLRNLGTYSGFSKAALILRRFRKADTERMVVGV
jgi:hypothetical protein